MSQVQYPFHENQVCTQSNENQSADPVSDSNENQKVNQSNPKKTN